MSGSNNTLKRKVISLSALSAGALAMGVGHADASIIYSGVLNQEVGWGNPPPPVSTDYISPDLGPLNASFKFFTHTGLRSTGTFLYRSIRADGRDLSFEGTVDKVAILNANATWSALGANRRATEAEAGARSWFQFTSIGLSGTRVSGNVPFKNKYALFRFEVAANSYDYGWIELTYAVTPGVGPVAADGPELDVEAWAYDNTGAMIKAGALPAATPEPGTLETTGLAALALGAAGLRRWRKTRHAA